MRNALNGKTTIIMTMCAVTALAEAAAYSTGVAVA